jgi:ribonuclease HIII
MEGHIGVDESGKGDYFGPLVIAACYVGPEHLAELEGVRDSKKLTDAMALQLANAIRATCPHKVIAISPDRYNAMYAETPNLNKLLAWAHAESIIEVLKVQPSPYAISDEFAKDGLLVKQKLARKGATIELRSMVRAEADVAVAAASILARAGFLLGLRRLSEQYGIDLPKGATTVIGSGRMFVAKHGVSELSKVAKLHFKTTQQVTAPGTQPR